MNNTNLFGDEIQPIKRNDIQRPLEQLVSGRSSIVTNEDCMIVMQRYPNKFFDIAIVDTPYGIGMSNSIASGTVGKRIEKNGSVTLIKRQPNRNLDWDVKPNKEYFDELKRVSKKQIIWGANNLISMIADDSTGWIVWDKKNGETNQSDCELAYTNYDCTVRVFRYMWCGMIQEEQNKNRVEKRIHPTQKPIALYKWIYKNYASAGQMILDTHLGSGSNRIAAYEAGMNFVGCEKDEQYYNDQEERFNTFIKKFVSQDCLFPSR